MTNAIQALLRRTLLASYGNLMARLTRRLGSPDLAAEALHETWLRLERPGNISDVANPESYLYRAAINTAANLRNAGARHLGSGEISALLEIPDEAPGAERIAMARAEIGALEQALAELPARQRAVFCEVMFQSTPYPVLAERYGVSTRTIYKDVEQALEHCARRLGKKSFFKMERRQLSGKQKDMRSGQDIA